MNLYTDLQNKRKRQQEVAGEMVEFWIWSANEAIKRYGNLKNIESVETRFSELLTLRKKMTWLFSRVVEFVDLIRSQNLAILTQYQKAELDRFDRWIKDRTQYNKEIKSAITLAENVEKIYAEINESREWFEQFANFFELKPIERVVSIMKHFDAAKILGGVEEVREKLDDLLESITADAQG